MFTGIPVLEKSTAVDARDASLTQSGSSVPASRWSASTMCWTQMLPSWSVARVSEVVYVTHVLIVDLPDSQKSMKNAIMSFNLTSRSSSTALSRG